MSMEEKSTFKTTDCWTSIKIYSPAAQSIVNFCEKLKIHPNVLTITGIFLALCSGMLYFWGKASIFTYITATLIYNLSWLMDHADGQLARQTGKTSALGAKLDLAGDKIAKLAVMTGMIAGPFLESGFLVPALLVFFFHYGNHFVINYILNKRYTPKDVWQQKRYLGFFTSFEESFFMLLTVPITGNPLIILTTWVLSTLLYSIDRLVFKN